MRQQYLAPAQSRSFLGFAERLTEGARRFENPDQVDRLLVHAFLQDLRRAYCRRPWRIEGLRRTAYPLLLVEGADSSSTGHRLPQLVNDVRNETGAGDPLLMVCTSANPPPGRSTPTATDPVPPDVGAEERTVRVANPIYGAWARELPWSRRARVRTAWYLSISVAEGGEPTAEIQPIKPPGSPWFARRAVVILAVLAIVIPLLGVAAFRLGVPGCSHRPFGGHVSVRSVAGQCIGYSDSSRFLFNNQPGQVRLAEIQRRIFMQNNTVRDIWASSGRRRPYVTLVYLGSLTGRPTKNDEEAYAAERQELEGLAVAQYDGIQKPATERHSALLHVVIANGGYQMRYADQAVDMIAELARNDPSVVAVVGLVDSRANVAGALRKLNLIGLPAIAPTLSADNFDQSSKLYLQIAPPNQDQARMLAEYARRELKVSTARVYWTVGEDATLDDDWYVRTLLQDLQNTLPRNGIRVGQPEQFTGSLSGADCGYQGMLLFAGRWSDFGSFLEELKACNDNQPRHLVADDSANRYMANPTLRKSAPGNLPLTFVSKAALGTCKNLVAARDEVRGRFLRWVRSPDLLSPARCTGPKPEQVGERVALAYDSAMMPLQAVEKLVERLRFDPQQPWDPRLITPLAVHAEMLRQNAEGFFAGVTGTIKFRPGSGEPQDKRISLLYVPSIPEVTEPVEVFHCGIARIGDSSLCRRPTGQHR